MRRILITTLAVLVGTLALAPAVVVAPAARAGQVESVSLGLATCTLTEASVSVRGIVLDRDNTGFGVESLRIDLSDGDKQLGEPSYRGVRWGRFPVSLSALI